MAGSIKCIIDPSYARTTKKMHIDWIWRYMKINFQDIVFMDVARVTLDVLDGWVKVWVPLGAHVAFSINKEVVVSYFLCESLEINLSGLSEY